VPARIVAGVVAALWSLFLLPPQMVAFSGSSGTPRWLRLLNNLDVYDALRDALDRLGWHDHYAVFGTAIAPAMALTWFALYPALWRLGWAGRAMSVSWGVLPPLTVLSYLNHPSEAPLRILWGSDAFVLVAIGLLGVVAAFTAPRDRGVPAWVRVLAGLTAVVGVGATLLGGYWPHATMVGLGIQAAVIAVWRPARTATPVSPSA
jgi:hypothetical protein